MDVYINKETRKITKVTINTTSALFALARLLGQNVDVEKTELQECELFVDSDPNNPVLALSTALSKADEVDELSLEVNLINEADESDTHEALPFAKVKAVLDEKGEEGVIEMLG